LEIKKTYQETGLGWALRRTSVACCAPTDRKKTRTKAEGSLGKKKTLGNTSIMGRGSEESSPKEPEIGGEGGLRRRRGEGGPARKPICFKKLTLSWEPQKKKTPHGQRKNSIFPDLSPRCRGDRENLASRTARKEVGESSGLRERTGGERTDVQPKVAHGIATSAEKASPPGGEEGGGIYRTTKKTKT